jgi:hypothetical protein
MLPAAVITGKVVDEDGEPLTGYGSLFFGSARENGGQGEWSATSAPMI